jgi:aminoglycoside phosphotransferase (APT) family kinase protein
MGRIGSVARTRTAAADIPARRKRGARSPDRVPGVERGGADAQARTRAIAQRLGEILGEPLTGELRRLSSGASRETFKLSTRSRGALVLQIARKAGKLVESPPQAALLAAAAEAGVLVPAVVAHGADDEVLGPSWTVAEALAGSTDPVAIIAGEDVPDAQQLIDDLAGALASIHRMPADLAGVPAVEDPLALLREWIDRLGEPHPAFELAFRALESQRPPPTRTTLVHGDFRMGNLMMDSGGLTGVLDWELAHVGDPIEDLGWLCVPAWRFLRPDRPAAGLATREELLDAYERHSGIAVDPAALRWWELAGTLRWGVICVMQAFTHLSGAMRSVEHAVIGRRACEVEWDLLELLDPLQEGVAPESDLPADRPTQAPALHDRPTMLELLDASREALGDDVLPHVEGRPAFQLRVVLRALGIVQRELAQQQEHTARHAAALATVGCADERELARAIRDGALGDGEAYVLAAVRATVRAKLEAANPAYPRKTEPLAKEER